MVPARLDQVRALPVETLQHFREHRDSPDITPEIKLYIDMMDAAVRYTKKNELSVRKCIELLTQEFPGTTYRQARDVYYDALDYFYLDDRLSARAWDMVYAEQFEDMKKLALAAGKMEIAYKCACKAHELRTKEREAKDVDWHAPVFQVNVNVRPEDLGFKSQKLMDISRRQEDEKIRAMIMGLQVPDSEKKRMLADAGLKWESAPAELQLPLPDEQ